METRAIPTKYQLTTDEAACGYDWLYQDYYKSFPVASAPSNPRYDWVVGRRHSPIPTTYQLTTGGTD